MVSRVISVAPPDLQELTPIHLSNCLSAGKGTHTETREKKKQKKTGTHLQALPIDNQSEWGVFHLEKLTVASEMPKFIPTWGFVRGCVDSRDDGNTPGGSE